MGGFKRNMVDKAPLPTGSGLNYRQKPSTSSTVLHTSEKGKFAGRTSGDYADMTDGRWWSVVLNNSTGTIAWVREDVVKFQTPPTKASVDEKKTQQIVDKLVINDTEIFHTLMRCAPLLEDAEKRKKNVSSYKNNHAQLTGRLEARQDKIKNSKILSWKSGIKKGYTKLKKSFLDYIKSPEYQQAAMMRIYGIGRCHNKIHGIGSVSITTIVISALVGAGLAIAAYFAFKPSYDESTVDLKMSQELEKALQNLSPEEAQKVQQDLEKQIDDAYNRGKIDSGISTGVKMLGFGLLGFLLVSTVILPAKKGKSNDQ